MPIPGSSQMDRTASDPIRAPLARTGPDDAEEHSVYNSMDGFNGLANTGGACSLSFSSHRFRTLVFVPELQVDENH